MNIILLQDNLNAVEIDLLQKLINAQQEIITNIENAQLHESGMELDQAMQYYIWVGEYAIWRGKVILICLYGLVLKRHA